MKNSSRNIFIILIIILILIISFLFIRINFPEGNNSIHINLENIWEKEITNIDVSPDSEFCQGKDITQTFSTRLSKQAPGTTYKGTFLQLSGSPTTTYIIDINSQRYLSRKILEKDLWLQGFKILEFKFSSKTGWHPDDHPDAQWEGTGITCEIQTFVKALEEMTTQGIWPSNQKDRYMMGTSNGAILISHAVDYYNSAYAKSNRILLQSPIFYDVYNQCKESPITTFTDFWFKQQCRNPAQNKEFFEQQTIKYALNSASCSMTQGSDSYLIIYGEAHEVPAWYKDESERYVPDREALCPIQTASWDAPTKYEGHSPIVDYYPQNGHVDPWVNYFLTGEVNFS